MEIPNLLPVRRAFLLSRVLKLHLEPLEAAVMAIATERASGRAVLSKA
jgi:hypothetical protein